MRSSGGTATGDAHPRRDQRSCARRPGSTASAPPAAIVLLSDGKSTSGVDAARRGAGGRRGATSRSTPSRSARRPGRSPCGRRAAATETRQVPPDPATLRADRRGLGRPGLHGRRRRAPRQVYERLGSQLGRKNEPRQISSISPRQRSRSSSRARHSPCAGSGASSDNVKENTMDRRRSDPRARARRAARGAPGGAARDQARDRRPGRDARAAARLAARRRPRPARGRSRASRRR